MQRRVFILAALVPLLAASAPRASLEARSSVRVEMDGCLDHTVRELGMSAQRQGSERQWRIGPQFLHPALVPDGSVLIRLERGEVESTVVVRAEWSGPMGKDARRELEERLAAMASRMTQACGVARPVVTCIAEPGGTAPCAR